MSTWECRLLLLKQMSGWMKGLLLDGQDKTIDTCNQPTKLPSHSGFNHLFNFTVTLKMTSSCSSGIHSIWWFLFHWWRSFSLQVSMVGVWNKKLEFPHFNRDNWRFGGQAKLVSPLANLIKNLSRFAALLQNKPIRLTKNCHVTLYSDRSTSE